MPRLGWCFSVSQLLTAVVLVLCAGQAMPQTASPSRSPAASFLTSVFGPSAVVVLRIGDGVRAAGLHTARPLFTDVIDSGTGAVIASYPWRSATQTIGGVQQHRCTQSWSVNSNIQLSADFRFLMVGCYDAAPYVDELSPWLPSNASTKASARIIGRMAADASVDSRTVVAASDCDEARLTGVASTSGEWMAVSTMPLTGTSDPSRCSLRVVPFGNIGGGDYGLLNPAVWSVTAVTLAFRALLAYDATRPSGFMEVGASAADRPEIDAGTSQRMDTLLQLPLDQQPQTVVAYVADGIVITQAPDGSTCESASTDACSLVLSTGCFFLRCPPSRCSFLLRSPRTLSGSVFYNLLVPLRFPLLGCNVCSVQCGGSHLVVRGLASAGQRHRRAASLRSARRRALEPDCAPPRARRTPRCRRLGRAACH